MWPFMPALHSALRSSLKNEIGLILDAVLLECCSVIGRLKAMTAYA
jgi:hypothetical protein